MNHKIALAAATLLMALAGASQAQTTCTCNSSAARTADSAALTTLLTNKMVCANVGGEVWQEYHNPSGALWDYKLGPTDTRDPSAPVGTYTVNANNTVTYTYSGGGGQYTYDVCFVSATGTYTYCGSNYGGRNITGARIGGAGLSSCAGVTVVAPSGNVRTR